ncbi:hypothetical protein ROHU_015512 [Labeo rohita]|uniref:Uncharacterized protein n=1 Tax=Labeo rohita TaxID=84645 RepID=A0A498NN77_LABRO|nr:hypothetical protein ROHU_015512 [Labeo rohita]
MVPPCHCDDKVLLTLQSAAACSDCLLSLIYTSIRVSSMKVPSMTQMCRKGRLESSYRGKCVPTLLQLSGELVPLCRV